jgi:hypothetical protein
MMREQADFAIIRFCQQHQQRRTNERTSEGSAQSTKFYRMAGRRYDIILRRALRIDNLAGKTEIRRKEEQTSKTDSGQEQTDILTTHHITVPI